MKTIQINLKKSGFPNIIYPQLATLVSEAPQGNQWLHELKFDGYRILAFKHGDDVRLMSRNNRKWTEFFSNVVHEIKKISVAKAIFDGEIVLLDEKQQSNFQLLQNSIRTNIKKPFIYYIFDLLYYDQFNLMDLPLIERKDILHRIIKTDHPVLRYSDHVIGSGEKIFMKACEMGLEGIVSKNIQSRYEEYRSKTWLKVKCLHRQEFVIGGYTPAKGARSYFGSLFLGVYNAHKQLVYCGNVGTGFNQSSLKSIHSLLEENRSLQNPFTTNPPGVTTATWVKPVLVAEVEFSEWTKDGILRHPSFKGLRTDKPAYKITREKEISVKEIEQKQIKTNKVSKILPIKLTNPNKILYPEDNITKADLANYYEEIHEWILPYILNRPLTLVRCPETYKDCFYQKHINQSTPKQLHGISIRSESKNKIENCIYIKNYEGLLALAQMRALEIHPWGSRVEKVEYPDYITFDLDPAPDVTWKKVVKAAFEIKNYLKEFQLESFVKTTGGKGLHIVIPIQPEFTWDEVKHFTHVFVQFLVMNKPHEYISEMSKTKRKGKIFVDYLRNQRGATSIAPYSTRARIHAPIAVPLAWDELTNDIKAISFTIHTLPLRLSRLQKDPWANFYKIKQSLQLDQL